MCGNEQGDKGAEDDLKGQGEPRFRHCLARGSLFRQTEEAGISLWTVAEIAFLVRVRAKLLIRKSRLRRPCRLPMYLSSSNIDES